MTTIYEESTGKTIQYSISNAIHECIDQTFIVEMPTVVCENRKDAERIQSEVGAYISELSRKIVKE